MITGTAAVLAAAVQSAAGPVAADSSGIRITTAAAPAAEPAIHVARTPAVRIGGSNAEGPYQLWQVNAAYRDETGRIFVSVAGESEVRIYDARGRHTASYGGRGRGPREFAEFSSMDLYPVGQGRVAVTDRFNRRIHVIDGEGRFVGAIEMSAVGGAGAIRGRFADGAWLVVSPAPGDPVRSGGVSTIGLTYHRVEPDWSAGREILTARSRPRQGVETNGRTVGYPIPLTVDDLAFPLESRIASIPGGQPEVRVLDADGKLQAILRWSPERRPVDAIWKRYREEVVRGTDPGRRASTERIMASDLPVPDVVPHAVGVRVDADRRIWVERYRLPWEEQRSWDVLSDNGAWLATVDMPGNVEVLQVGSDFILGVARDELDVESVVVFPLERR